MLRVWEEEVGTNCTCVFSLGLVMGIRFPTREKMIPTREVFCHDLSHFLTSLLVNDLHLTHFLQSTKGKG